MKKYVLDASAFINSSPALLRGYTTPSVLDELKSIESRAYLWVIGEQVEVKEPSPYYVKRVRRALRDLGERKLSETDISVLSLALQEKLPLITDDFNLQNVALYMGVEVYSTGFGKIKRIVKYRWICIGCGREYKVGTKRCGVCGSPVRPQSFLISVVDDM